MEKHLNFTTQAEFVTEASQSNPDLGWLEFILTDSEPNANNQGIPAEAFNRLVETGLFMPVKVAEDGIRMDHSNALPLGPITKLEATSDQVKGKAAVWKRERPTMYKMLKEMREEGDDINISWELAYTKSTEDDNGITWLQDPRLLAATVVGNPAYEGRTQVLSVASKSEIVELKDKVSKNEEFSTSDKEELISILDFALDSNWSTEANEDEHEDEDGEADSNGDEETMEELEKLQAEHEELQDKYDELATSLEEVQAERDELLAYKEEKEEAERKAALLQERVKVLEEAGVEVTEEDIEEKAEVWINMSDEGFASMVEMVSTVKSSQASSGSDIPDVSGDSAKIQDIVRQGLQELKTKK